MYFTTDITSESVSLVSCETLKAFSDFSRSRATESRVEKFSVCFSYQLFGEKKAAKKLQVFSQRDQSFSQSEVKIREFVATAKLSGQEPDCQVFWNKGLVTVGKIFKVSRRKAGKSFSRSYFDGKIKSEELLWEKSSKHTHKVRVD